MARRDAAPHELLFGLLALQNGMVTRDQLVAAFGAWTAADRPMADLLVEQGALHPGHRPLLDALADAHLKLHGGDPERSLASLDVRRSTRESLARAGGTDIEDTLARVGSGSNDRDADRTVTYTVDPAPAVGQRFRVLRFHARGGLGEVFVALDTELNREVALKRIRTERVDDPSSRSRFLLEAEVTGHLEHPGVVPVYGLGDDGEWGPFYVMRLIKGETLKQAVDLFHQINRRGSRDPGERALALRQLLGRFVDVCNAVAYAHSRGVLHRDLKPANVMLGPFGETLVVDWGLAKVVGRRDAGPVTGAADVTFQPPSGGSGATQPGTAVGSPAYMSPEQAGGGFDRIGPASDVYSLGATLYYLLAGRPPFQDADIRRVLRDVQHGAFPRPGAVAEAVDPTLEAVCLKAMARDSAERYPSARVLADEVETWLASDYRKLQEAHEALKKIEEALRMSEELYRQLIEGGLDGIVVIDGGGGITPLNPAAERMFGYGTSEVVGRHLAVLMPTAFSERADRPFDRDVLDRRPGLVGRTVELAGRRKNGEEFPLELSLSLVERGGDVLFIGSMRDQTERQRMRVILAQSEKLASFGLLSAGVAHEISNPLAFVGNNLEVLNRDLNRVSAMMSAYESGREALKTAAPEVLAQIDALSEEIDWPYVSSNLERQIAKIREGIQRVTKIAQHLRGLTPTASPKLESSLLRDLVVPAVEIIQGQGRRKNIQVIVNDAPSIRLSCVGSQINQVILNLLVNAMDAVESANRPEGGKIVVVTEVRDEMVAIIISDNGCGIPPEYIPHIFDPFFTTKKPGEGTGLGLSISHGIVRGHGGWIEVESKPGRGSRFCVVLPQVQP